MKIWIISWVFDLPLLQVSIYMCNCFFGVHNQEQSWYLTFEGPGPRVKMEAKLPYVLNISKITNCSIKYMLVSYLGNVFLISQNIHQLPYITLANTTLNHKYFWNHKLEHDEKSMVVQNYWECTTLPPSKQKDLTVSCLFLNLITSAAQILPTLRSNVCLPWQQQSSP